MLRKQELPLHKSVLKWEQVIRWIPKQGTLWQKIWRPYYSAKQNCFLWQVAFNIPTTNHWTFPGINHADPTTWCLCCPLRLHEDVLHLLQNCPVTKPIWSWMANILRYLIPIVVTSLRFNVVQALLGVPLGPHNGFQQCWWNILRAIACWEIWKARCSLVMEHTHVNTIALWVIIWMSLRAHLQVEWDPFSLKIKQERLTQEEVEKAFTNNFGFDEDIFTFVNSKLQVTQALPRVPQLRIDPTL